MRRALGALFLTSSLACVATEENPPPIQDSVAEFARRAALPAPTRCVAGETLVLAVPLDEDASLEATYDAVGGRLRLLYRMAFNQLTEGWNWHPENTAAGGDYYVFKYLPVGSTSEDRGSYRGEDKIGAPQDFRVHWRYDYFLAFDNPYEFYAPEGDDTGFAAEIALPAEEADRLARGDLRMAVRARLVANCLSDSTTFWKATSAKPVDFTLKKRYFVGKLDEVWFHDAKSGKTLARFVPRR